MMRTGCEAKETEFGVITDMWRSVLKAVSQLNTHDTPLKANSADIVADSAWRWYSTEFTEVV